MGIETIVGITGIVLAVVAFVVSRVTNSEPAIPEPSAWRADDGTLTAPGAQTPATVGPLTHGEVTHRDTRLSLLDLASRGYLHLDITPVHTDDWVLRRTSKQLGADLHDHEWFLLSGPFTDELGNPATLTWGALRDDPTRPLDQAEDRLGDELTRRGWISTQATAHHSAWAWTGAVVLLIGLVTTLYMLIDWLASHDFMGVIGGLGVMTAGFLLVSRGRRHAPLGVEGLAAQQECRIWQQRLDEADLNGVTLDDLGDVFGSRLVWQIAFQNPSDLVAALEAERARAAKWSTPITVDISWLTSGDLSPEQISERLSAFVAGSRLESSRLRQRVVRQGSRRD